MTDEEYKQMGLIVLKKWFKDKFNINIADTEIEEKYNLALKRLINNAKSIDDIKLAGVVQATEGSQSMTFRNGTEAWTFSDDILALLPTPSNVFSW